MKRKLKRVKSEAPQCVARRGGEWVERVEGIETILSGMTEVEDKLAQEKGEER